MKYGKLLLSQIAIIVVAFSSSAAAQDERLSLEWVFSEEGKTATSLPEHAWLDNGLLLLYDKRARRL